MKMEASTAGSEAEHIRDLVVARTLRKLALSVEQARMPLFTVLPRTDILGNSR